MNYAECGDGLRISVGTDEQIDACLALVGQFLRNGHRRSEKAGYLRTKPIRRSFSQHS